MPPYAVQDDIVRRALDFFGLRGFIPHDYETTIQPIVILGNLEQPQIQTDNFLNSTPSTDLFLVPAGELWKPLSLAFAVTQSAGTVAPSYAVGYLSSSGATFFQQRIPAYFGSNVGDSLSFNASLNGTTRFYVRFPDNLLMPPGSRLQYLAPTGDGTFSLVAEGGLIYRRLGEPTLVQQQL